MDYTAMKVKELREVAKNFKIKKYWLMKKAELIEAISEAEKIGKEVEQVTIEETSVNINNENTDDTAEIKKNERIKTANVGDIIAVYIKKENRYRSGAIMKKDDVKNIVTIETEYKRKYTVEYDCVIWVKTPGRRWPKGVYKALTAHRKGGSKK